MKYFKNQRCDFKHPVVAMGTFDGVHLGHQKLLEKLKEKAKAVNGESVVITYYHHPLETIHRSTFPYLLTEKDKKEELIKELGIDYVLYLDFNEKMAKMEPEKFLKDIIIDKVNAKKLIVGYDTHFGKNRSGEYEFLKKNEARFGYTIEFVEPFKIENRIISSSIIRDFIREGDIIDALKLLGRYYSVAGFVITGHRIGREIGFPTINVQPADPHKLLPGIGVYICEVILESKKYLAVTNVGYSPTLKKTQIKEIETHILDFENDLYNKKVEILFHKKLRNEFYFENKEDLIKEIQNDVRLTREYFDK